MDKQTNSFVSLTSFALYYSDLHLKSQKKRTHIHVLFTSFTSFTSFTFIMLTPTKSFKRSACAHVSKTNSIRSLRSLFYYLTFFLVTDPHLFFQKKRAYVKADAVCYAPCGAHWPCCTQGTYSRPVATYPKARAYRYRSAHEAYLQ